MFSVGDTVRVARHTAWQSLSKGTVIDPPIERFHNGFKQAVITAILDDGFDGDIIEVETPGGHVDLVPPSPVSLLKAIAPEG